MSFEHSDNFNRLVSNDGFNSEAFANEVNSGTISGRAITDLLMELKDSYTGIVSGQWTDENGEVFWLRDASNVLPLDTIDRKKPDSEDMLTNEMVCRCVNLYRAIDYAIAEKYKNLPVNLDDIRNLLKSQLSDLIKEAYSSDRKDTLKSLEAEFNTGLIYGLHVANLTKGCATEEDAKSLLVHYRNLSNGLDPALPVTTITKMGLIDDELIFSRETAYPVTEKTPQQIKELDKLSNLVVYPSNKEINSHTRLSLAAQEANQLYLNLMKDPKHMFGAQARKTHLPSAKNAYGVVNECFKVPRDTTFEEMMSSALVPVNKFVIGRTGSPVYVGSGEGKETIIANATENLKQIEKLVRQKGGIENKRGFILFSLNSANPLSALDAEKEKKVIEYGEAAVNALNPTKGDITIRYHYRRKGVNPLGADNFYEWTNELERGTHAIYAIETIDGLKIIHCLSGMDRTGEIVERLTRNAVILTICQLRGHDFSKKDIRKAVKSNIENKTKKEDDPTLVAIDPNLLNIIELVGASRAASGHATYLNGHMDRGGLSGGKPKSKLQTLEHSDFFSIVNAHGNKCNPVTSAVAKIFKLPTKLAKKEFDDLFDSFNTALNVSKLSNPQIKQYFIDVRTYVMEIKQKSKKIPADLPLIIRHTNRLLELVQEKNLDKDRINYHAQRLQSIAMCTQGKQMKIYHCLGVALGLLACAVLIFAGFALSAPTFGVSHGLTGAGVFGFCALSATAAGFFSKGRRQHLSSAVDKVGKACEIPSDIQLPSRN